nr:hypothetical protein [Clostridia bacterium]
LLTSEMLNNAMTHVCRRYGEFWICRPDGMLVYNIKNGLWYSFEGIYADGFFETDETCYWRDSRIFIFDDALGSDGGLKFEARCETGFIDFGYPHLNKRLHRVFVSFDPAGDGRGTCSASLELKPDRSDSHTLYGLENSEELPLTVRQACEIPRFSFLRLTLSDKSDGALSITQIGLQYHLLGECTRNEDI